MDADAPDSQTVAALRPPASALALLVLAWLVGALFLTGDLGWWNDDFFFNQRDPASGVIASLAADRPTPFSEAGTVGTWRPLHNLLAPTLITLTWETPHLAHALQAVLHLCTALALLSLARGLRLPARAGVAGALLYVSAAPIFEVVFWVAAVSTTLAMALLATSCALCAHAASRGRGWLAWAGALVALPIPLLNEQPAAMTGALPFIFLAATPPTGTLWRTVRDAAGRWWAPVALVWGAIGLYAALLVTGVGREGRGGLGPAGGVIPSHVWWESFVRVLRTTLLDVRYQFLGLGAWEQGLSALREHPGRALLAGGALIGALVPTVRWWITSREDLAWLARASGGGADRAGGAGAGQAEAQAPRPMLVLLAAGAVLVSGSLPLALVGTGGRPRMAVAGVLAGALVVMALLTLGRMHLAKRAAKRGGDGGAGRTRVFAGLTGMVVLATAALGTVSLVGVQHGFQRRWALDVRLASNLRTLAPDPSPGTVFVALEHEAWPLRTRSESFNIYFVSAFHDNWAQPFFIQRAYARTDVRGVGNGVTTVAFADERVMVPALSLTLDFPRDPMPAWADPAWGPTAGAIAWERVVPIVIDANAEVTLVTRLTLVRPDGTTFDVAPARAAEVAARAGVQGEHRTLRLR